MDEQGEKPATLTSANAQTMGIATRDADTSTDVGTSPTAGAMTTSHPSNTVNPTAARWKS